MQRRRRSFLAAALVLSAMMAFTFSVVPSASAEAPLDYPVSNGHYFNQAVPDSAGPGGFSVTNGDGMRFWDAFQEFGGVDNLGYPLSRRFGWHGRVYQVTQKAVLEGNAVTGQVQLANIMDQLSLAGKDEWLEKVQFIPRPVAVAGDGGGTPDELVAAHQALLDGTPISRAFYFALPQRAALLGLPQSRVEDLGPCYGVRFQRGAFYVWKEAVNGLSQGQITVARIGLIVREAGLFDRSVFEPEAAPAMEETAPVTPQAVSLDLRNGSDRGGVVRSESARIALPYSGTSAWQGTATWYGEDFQGCLMRNEEPYDMYDPTIAASNVYPLGAILLVTNTASGDSIKVRVTDTGAFGYPIIVDLSYAAFRELAPPSAGVIRVVVERLQ